MDGAVSLYIGENASADVAHLRPWDGHVFEVTFIGREPDLEGSYGHLGWSKHVIFVEKFLSIKPDPELEEPLHEPPPPLPPLRPTSPESPNNRMQRTGSP
jgi:hypothetical protein